MGGHRIFGIFSIGLVSLALATCSGDGSGTAGLTDSGGSTTANSSTTAAEPTTTAPPTTAATETTEATEGGTGSVSGTTTGGTTEATTATTGDGTTEGATDSTTATTGAAPFCGDGSVDDGEECDDGNVVYMARIGPCCSNSIFCVS